MGLRFFTIPIQDSAGPEGELNGFLSSHKVLAIERRWVDLGTNSFWTICVEYLNVSTIATSRDPTLSRNRVDYKTILPQAEFDVFSQLRQLRKEMAQAEILDKAASPRFDVELSHRLSQPLTEDARNRQE